MATRPQPNPDHFGGARVKAKRPTVTIRSGYVATIEHQLLASTGAPRDLTEFGFDESEVGGESEPTPNVIVRIFETAHGTAQVYYADVVDAATGQIRLELPACLTETAGLYLMEFGVVDANNARHFIDDAYLHIERSTSGPCSGPPALAELRLFLRDYAQENELLDAVDFDASEVAFAIQMCIDQWNESDPWDGPRYSTENFPYRRNWLIGITHYLFQIAAEHYARNGLPNQTGGIAYDDKGRVQLYQQKALLAKQDWDKFVIERKTVAAAQVGFHEITGLFW